jgi:hypothetical protein
VKVTSFSTAVLVLLALAVFAIWPEHRPGPAPQPALAQAPEGVGGKAADPADPKVSAKKVQPADSDLQEKLARRLTAEFVETPLPDVLQFLADMSDVQIFINRKAIENEGVPLDTPITINLKNVQLEMLLDLILEQASSDGGLTYVERDGILIVSTMANLEGASEVRVYNCRDLLSMVGPKNEKGAVAAEPAPAIGGFGGGMGGLIPAGAIGGGEAAPVALSESEQRAEALKRLIQTAVKANSWSDVGGIGTISEYNGLIVINHDAKTHKQVDNVLQMLRDAAGLEPGRAAKILKQ